MNGINIVAAAASIILYSFVLLKYERHVKNKYMGSPRKFRFWGIFGGFVILLIYGLVSDYFAIAFPVVSAGIYWTNRNFISAFTAGMFLPLVIQNDIKNENG